MLMEPSTTIREERLVSMFVLPTARWLAGKLHQGLRFVRPFVRHESSDSGLVRFPDSSNVCQPIHQRRERFQRVIDQK